MWARNIFSRSLDGASFVRWGGVPGHKYRAAFKTVCMGDLNAVDIAHCTHEDLLVHAEAMFVEQTVSYREPVPDSKVWNFLYIDDRWITAIVPSDPVARETDPAMQHLRRQTIAAGAAYERAWLPRALDKGGD